jgi:DNA end-binding protein Ku
MATKKKRTAKARAEPAAARAMWKGQVVVGDDEVPVKLYAGAVGRGGERGVRFRLLHAADLEPIRQRSVHPESGEPVERDDVKRGLEVEPGVFVVLEPEELEALAPEPSRDIEVVGFLDPAAIPAPFHERPYHLGPDGDPDGYLALVEALRDAGKVAVVRWVMRNQRYSGALAAHEGRLSMTTLRRWDEVVLVHGVAAPGGRALDAKEKRLAAQLVEALEGPFEHEEFHDQYQERVRALVEAKARGKALPRPRVAPKEPTPSLAAALRKSLQAAKERVSA